MNHKIEGGSLYGKKCTFWPFRPGCAARKNSHGLLEEKNVLKNKIFEVPPRHELGQFTLDNWYGRPKACGAILKVVFKSNILPRLKQSQKQDIWCRTQPAVLLQKKIVP